MKRPPTYTEARVLRDMGMITEAEFQHYADLAEWRKTLRAGANTHTTPQPMEGAAR